MYRLRTGSLALCAALACAACTKSSPSTKTLGRGSSAGAAVEVATFTGSFDPATGKMTISSSQSTAPGALTEIIPLDDGAGGSGPDNTIEIRTLPLGSGGSYGQIDTGCTAGNLRAYHGIIRIQSFFRNQTLTNVYAELTRVTPEANAGCNSVASAPTGLSNTLGLWSYGTIAPGGHADADWHFRYVSDVTFSFTGRIMATLGAPTATSVPFDWTPTSLVNPPRSFQDQGTTLAHLTWTGTLFDDSIGTLDGAFVTSGGTVTSSSNGLMDPAQPYAVFTSGAYLVETPTGGGAASRLDIAEGVTVCAKIKPGTTPGAGGIKTIFAKGDPGATINTLRRGFALEQTPGGYAFHYRTADNDARGDGEYWSTAGTGANPENYDYDYICGGRADVAPNPTDGYLYAQAHGAEEAAQMTAQSNFFLGTTLPLAIGAMSDGYAGAGDIGIYEIIIDSRGATVDVMRDIVGRAEGRVLAGSTGFSATFIPTIAVAKSFVGANGGTYTLPPFATFPVSSDGTGLMDLGVQQVQYTHPLDPAVDTTLTGFCVGAQLQATGAWSSARGTLFNVTSNATFVAHVNPPLVISSGTPKPAGEPWVGAGTLPSWTSGSTHVIKTCVSSGGQVRMWGDTDYTTPIASGVGAIPNLGASTAKFGIGSELPGQPIEGDGGPLSGVRIRRTFICSGSDPATCN